MRLARAAVALVMVVSLGMSGCATLFASGPDIVPVQTNPPGAWVYVNGIVVGQTPTTIALDRERGGQVQIYLPGFQPVMLFRSKSLNGWFIANILWVYAVVPVIIDVVTGNWQRYDDTPILIGLTPANVPPPNWYRQAAPTGPAPTGPAPMGPAPMGPPPPAP